MKYTIYIHVLLFLLTGAISAQEKFEYKIIAGFNIGATAPAPLPAEVRSITAYWPQFTPQLGYTVTYNHSPKWGLMSGIMLDLKGMGVRDKVKYMYTSVTLSKENGSKMEGYFVGRNETTVKLTYITIPLYVTYRMNNDWQFKVGGYASYNYNSSFKGYVWDGYMRVENMTGTKFEIKDKGDARFDFGDDIRDFDFGVGVGAERRINNRFGVYSNFTWGLTSIFPSDYKAIDFKMYNIYLTLGLTYNLNK